MHHCCYDLNVYETDLFRIYYSSEAFFIALSFEKMYMLCFLLVFRNRVNETLYQWRTDILENTLFASKKKVIYISVEKIKMFPDVVACCFCVFKITCSKKQQPSTYIMFFKLYALWESLIFSPIPPRRLQVYNSVKPLTTTRSSRLHFAEVGVTSVPLLLYVRDGQTFLNSDQPRKYFS